MARTVAAGTDTAGPGGTTPQDPPACHPLGPASRPSRPARLPAVSTPAAGISWPGEILRDDARHHGIPRDVRLPGSEGGALGDATPFAGVQVALSTASVLPERAPDAFETAARLGYDGIEVMVALDPVSQDLDVLRRLSDYHGVPVLAVHAPCLLITQRVWGREPWGKLDRAREVAEKLGSKVVVVHPPFRWQRDYAREFEAGLTRMGEETDVVFAVENLYPLRARGAEVTTYAPHWNPVDLDTPHATLDLSHTAVSGSDALAMADDLG